LAFLTAGHHRATTRTQGRETIHARDAAIGSSPGSTIVVDDDDAFLKDDKGFFGAVARASSPLEQSFSVVPWQFFLCVVLFFAIVVVAAKRRRRRRRDRVVSFPFDAT
jgi:apolipoprotein N-acyltransferase